MSTIYTVFIFISIVRTEYWVSELYDGRAGNTFPET